MSINRNWLLTDSQNTRKSTMPKTRCGKSISVPNDAGGRPCYSDSIIDLGSRKEAPIEHKRQKNSALSEMKHDRRREKHPKTQK